MENLDHPNCNHSQSQPSSPRESNLDNQELVNQVSGHRFRTIFTGKPGEVLELEVYFPPEGEAPGMHAHPSQDEFYYVRSGTLTVRTDFSLRSYPQGQMVHIRRGRFHSVWNQGHLPASATWISSPGLRSLKLLHSFLKLAAKGRTDGSGSAVGILEIWLSLRFFDVYRSRYSISRLRCAVFARLAILLGKKGMFGKKARR